MANVSCFSSLSRATRTLNSKIMFDWRTVGPWVSKQGECHKESKNSSLLFPPHSFTHSLTQSFTTATGCYSVFIVVFVSGGAGDVASVIIRPELFAQRRLELFRYSPLVWFELLQAVVFVWQRETTQESYVNRKDFGTDYTCFTRSKP